MNFNSCKRVSFPSSSGVRLLVVASLILAAVLCRAQTSILRAEVNLVNVTFGARSSDGEPVFDLTPAEVQILEDNVPQKIKFFSRTSDLPLTLGLIVDASDSQQSFFKKHHSDVEKFLKDVLGPKDQAFLVCFGNQIGLISDLTSSASQIMESYESLEHGDGKFPALGPPERRVEGTALFDAIIYATRERLASPGPARRALIVFSDGEDNSSAYTEMDAIATLQSADVMVYSIRYTEQKKGRPTSRDKYGMRIMQRLARDTGAAEFDATANPDMDRAFRQIGTELRSLYEVAYHATNAVRDGTFRKLAVRTNRSGLTIWAKAGYFAEP
ncbi:MAG TPA: VWA domain-containing protein [Terriglobales bacterium]|nr:VWA domain-containing protein [Terriglobales bacterium]